MTSQIDQTGQEQASGKRRCPTQNQQRSPRGVQHAHDTFKVLQPLTCCYPLAVAGAQLGNGRHLRALPFTGVSSQTCSGGEVCSDEDGDGDLSLRNQPRDCGHALSHYFLSQLLLTEMRPLPPLPRNVRLLLYLHD
eukprot:766558-Hanusia_phi.AAC.1